MLMHQIDAHIFNQINKLMKSYTRYIAGVWIKMPFILILRMAYAIKDYHQHHLVIDSFVQTNSESHHWHGPSLSCIYKA